MGRNRLASARQRLPGLVLVLILTVSSAVGWPWDAGTRVRLCLRSRPA
jgi:hypothetical protein